MEKRVTTFMFVAYVVFHSVASDCPQSAMRDRLYMNSAITRENMVKCVQSQLKPENAVLLFEYRIPFSRSTYCVGMSTNVAVMGIVTTGRVDFVKYKLDKPSIILRFVETLQKYESTSISMSTGPKDLYVTVYDEMESTCHRFDYPVWVMQNRIMLPRDAFCGCDDNTKIAYEMMCVLFQKWILPKL